MSKKCKECDHYWIDVVSPAVQLPTCKITDRMAKPEMKISECDCLPSDNEGGDHE